MLADEIRCYCAIRRSSGVILGTERIFRVACFVIYRVKNKRKTRTASGNREYKDEDGNTAQSGCDPP